MRALILSIACLSVILITSCSSRNNRPTSSSGTAYALGEVSEDRSLFFTEGEDFKDKSGGDLDYKGGASKGKCLGMRWGEKPTDYVTYAFNLNEAPESAILVLRAAFEGTVPQLYDVLIDNNTVSRAELHPTGGYGYVDKEWQCFSIPLGRIAKGQHILTIRSTRSGEIINIDCLVIGKAQ